MLINLIPGILPPRIPFSFLKIRDGDGVGNGKEEIIINLESHLGTLTSSKGRGQQYTQVGAFCIWNILSSPFFIHFSTSFSPVGQNLDLTRALLIGTFTKEHLFLEQRDKKREQAHSKCRKIQQTSMDPPLEIHILRVTCYTLHGPVLGELI